MAKLIHVGRTNLESAFENHLKEGKSCTRDSGSAMLLLVYGVECGLKALLLDRRGVFSTEKLDDEDFTHDLDALLRKLGRPPSISHWPASIPKQEISPQQIHTVFRYGGKFASNELTALKTELLKICDWIKEQL